MAINKIKNNKLKFFLLKIMSNQKDLIGYLVGYFISYGLHLTLTN